MNNFQYAKLSTDIMCGKLDCLRSCCDEQTLRYIHGVMHAITADDIPTFTRMLCGCAPGGVVPGTQVAPPQLPPPPQQQSNCVGAFAAWLDTHRDALNTLQMLLISFGGASVPGLDQVAAGVSLALEALEDVIHSKPNESTVATKMDTICGLLGQLDALAKWVASNVPDEMGLLKSAMDKLPVAQVLSLGCCYSAPQLTTTSTGGGTGTGRNPPITIPVDDSEPPPRNNTYNYAEPRQPARIR